MCVCGYINYTERNNDGNGGGGNDETLIIVKCKGIHTLHSHK